jgi:glycosidase
MNLGKKLTPALLLTVLIAAAARAAAPAAWWRHAVFYEVFVRSFADASHGPLAGDGVGDLQGLIDHLDYLNDGDPHSHADLGVNALWLMPVNPSPSYHGYDVTDYFAVNPQYGDTALMKRFVSEAHRRGIRVIVDLVLNHASSQHPLFLRAVAGGPNAPERRLFRFAPLPEELRGPWDQEPWHHTRDGFYYGIFSAAMPDWNFRDPAVTAHHRRVADYWLREVGVDGFRLDAVRYFFEDGEEQQDLPETKAWLRDFTAYCHTIKPDSFVIGEVAAPTSITSDYLNRRSLDSVFEFDFARATIWAVRDHLAGIYAQQLQRMQRAYATPDDWATLLDNHDQERVASQLGEDDRKLKFAAELQLTSPGVPFVYYGEEIGMTGRKPDPDLRTPMQWTGAPGAGFSTATPWHAVNPDFERRNVATESSDEGSLLSLYRRLIRLNEASTALRRGQVVGVTVAAGNVYAAMRQTADEVVLVLANFNAGAVPQPDVSAAASNLRAGWTARNELGSQPVAPLVPAGDGSFHDWAPVAELPGQAVTVIRWLKP